MSLADDLSPEQVMEAVGKVLEERLQVILRHVPTGNECSQEDLAKKWTVLGSCLRTIKEYTREGLKAVQIGSDSTAFNLVEASKHQTLDKFTDAKIEITGPDGKTVETTFDKFNKAAEAVQKDPSILQGEA